MYYLMNKDNIVAKFEKSDDILDNEFHMIDSEQNKMPLGFEDINIFAELKLEAPSEGEQRVFFTARKPKLK